MLLLVEYVLMYLGLLLGGMVMVVGFVVVVVGAISVGNTAVVDAVDAADGGVVVVMMTMVVVVVGCGDGDNIGDGGYDKP